jgi:hypothetical protein
MVAVTKTFLFLLGVAIGVSIGFYSATVNLEESLKQQFMIGVLAKPTVNLKAGGEYAIVYRLNDTFEVYEIWIEK